MTVLNLTDEQVLVIREALAQSQVRLIVAVTDLTVGDVMEARGGILRQLDGATTTEASNV